MPTIDRAVSLSLTVAALTITAATFRREFITTDREIRPGISHPPEYQPEWERIMASGVVDVRDTDSIAPVTIIAFIDLECPACSYYHRAILTPIRERYGSRIRVAFVPRPLNLHRFARAAAVAAECSARQGRFVEFIEGIFAQQDSIGLKPWVEYAAQVGVSNTEEFQRCLGSPDAVARVAAGEAVADSLGIRATPTLMINGWLFSAPPTFDIISRAIDDILTGRDSFASQTSREVN